MASYEIYNGDCLKIMDMLIKKGIQVDAIITDPPYGTTACKWDSIIPFDEMWDKINKIIKPNGAIILFGSEPFSSKLRISNIKNYRYDWIWHKNSSGSFATAKKRPMKYHENISVFYKKQPTYNPQFQEYSESSKKRFKDGEMVNRNKQLTKSTNQIQNGLSFEGKQGIMIERGKYPESVQKFNNCANQKRIHPTQKPIDLMEYLIKTYTNENETILDFTMGSGSTGVACINTNRNFIGIELDESYYNIAKDRMKKAKEGYTNEV